MICWVIFSKYLVCLEINYFKCAHLSSVDDNTNNCIFFMNNTSTFKCPFLWQIVGNSILVIIYDTQSWTSGVVISRMNKSLSIRLYNNHLSLSDMFGKSVFSSSLWLNSECGNRPGIGISLIMCHCFFVIFQQTFRIAVLVSMRGYSFLYLLLYNRCCGGFKPLLLLWSTYITYSGFLVLLNFLFSRHDFLLFLLFFGIDLCGPTLLDFLVGCVTTLVKITLFCRSILESTWLGH